jgi:hypothetical protein
MLHHHDLSCLAIAGLTGILAQYRMTQRKTSEQNLYELVRGQLRWFSGLILRDK